MYCRFACQVILVAVLLTRFSAHAGAGAYVGTGIPLNFQGGIVYQFSPSYMLELSYNKGNSLTDCRDFDLRIAQLGLNYYPFAGTFFIGLGAGRTTLLASNVDPTTGTSFSMDAEATSAYAKSGWTWGLADGGFWFGIDVSVYKALSSKNEIHDNGVNTDTREYRLIQDAVTRFTDSSHMNITVARVGWSF